MARFSDRQLGVSFTASWAWGVSLGVGHALIQTRGLGAFLIWAFCNTFALLGFGWCVKRYPQIKGFCRSPAMAWFFLITQIYAIWINAHIMADYFGGYPIVVTAITATVFVMVAIGKFRLSVLSDQWQFACMMGGLSVAVILGLMFGSIKHVEFWTEINTRHWVLLTSAGLFVAPFHNAMYYQREEATTSFKPYIIHTGLFAIYMALVGVLGVIDWPGTQLLITIIIVAIATSTQDSAVAATQYLVGYRWSAIVVLVILALWHFTQQIPFLFIWEYYQVLRFGVVVLMLAYAIGVQGWTKTQNSTIN